MTIQEAYNKGLDDAETAAIAKLSNALQKIDDGPFANPAMEEVRQGILNKPSGESQDTFDLLEKIITGDTPEYSGSPRNMAIIKFFTELMNVIRTHHAFGSKPMVLIKFFLNKVDYELTFEKTKVN
jgi:hypothetical protein